MGQSLTLSFWVKLILEDPERAKTRLPTWCDILDNQRSIQPAVGTLSQAAYSALYERNAARTFNQSLCLSRHTNPLGSAKTLSDSFLDYFPNIDPQTAHRWWKDVVPYSPVTHEASMRDFCAWYERYEKIFQVFGREKGNYCLLVTVPPDVVQAAAELLYSSLPLLLQVALMLNIGRIIYNILKKDPLDEAWKLSVGIDGCPTREALYRRVISLHYCNYQEIPLSSLAKHIIYAMSSYMSEAQRRQFFQQISNKYPNFTDDGK